MKYMIQLMNIQMQHQIQNTDSDDLDKDSDDSDKDNTYQLKLEKFNRLLTSSKRTPVKMKLVTQLYINQKNSQNPSYPPIMKQYRVTKYIMEQYTQKKSMFKCQKSVA